MHKRPLAALAAIAIFAAACGGGADNGLAGKLKLNDDPNSALLIVRDEGGFVPADFLIRQGPRMVILRGGAMIAPGPMIMIYPGPMLTPYNEAMMSEDLQLFLLEELDAIGFATIDDETNNEAASMIADAANTVVTFYNRDGRHRFSVYALGLEYEFEDARVRQLGNLVSRLDEQGLAASQPYVPDILQVMAGVSEFPPEPQFANVRPWPLSISYAAMAPTNLTTWRCTTIEGAEVDRLLGVFSQANQVTTWDEGGIEYTLAVRPLFPGEEACATLGPAA
jgi:hypothetical protein